MLSLTTTGGMMVIGAMLVACSLPVFAQDQPSPLSLLPDPLQAPSDGKVLSQEASPQVKAVQENSDTTQTPNRDDMQDNAIDINVLNEKHKVIIEDKSHKNLIESIKKNKKEIEEEITDLAAIIAAQRVLTGSLQAKSKTGLLSKALCDKSPLKGNCSKLTGTFSKSAPGQKPNEDSE